VQGWGKPSPYISRTDIVLYVGATLAVALQA